jgi:tetratricopeptide (TPR) repeat protein
MRNYFHILLLILFSGFIFINSNAQSYNKLLKKAYKYHDKDDLENAEIWYNKAREKSPDDFSPYYNLADIYFDRNLYDTALTLINKSIERFQEDIFAYKLRAFIYKNLEREEDVIADVNLFLLNNVLQKDSIPLIALKAEANYNLGNYSEALNDYKTTLQYVSKDIWEDFCVPCYNMKIADCYIRTGNYKKALTHLDIAVKSTDCEQRFICKSLADRARLYNLLNEKSKSKNDFEAAIECITTLNDKRLDTSELPMIYAYLGNDTAIILVNNQILLDTQNNDTESLSYDYYYLACVNAVLGKKEEALKNIDLCLQLDSTQAKEMKTDIDLNNIKFLPEFTQLIQKYQTTKQ